MQALVTAGDPPFKTIRRNGSFSIAFNRTIRATITKNNRCLYLVLVRMLQLC